MKVPKPRQMSSGNWFIQLRIGGKSITVTQPTEERCIAEAMGIKSGLIEKERDPTKMTVGEGIDKYIELRTPVLSPSTIAGYKRLRKNCMQGIMSLAIRSLTQSHIQREVNAMAKEKSPKYIANAHGLLVAMLHEYAPDFRVTTALPSPRKPDIKLPNDADIAAIMTAVKGTSVEIPILMALWMGMRKSEIRGATFDCIENHRLHINKAIVDDEDMNPVLKYTKTYNSDRWVTIPAYIESLIDAIPEKSGCIVKENGSVIGNRFWRILKKNGLPTFSIHSLRHANAAVMLQLGVPNKYAQERGGWATDNVLKSVYQYTMDTKMQEVDGAVNAYFEKKAAEIT